MFKVGDKVKYRGGKPLKCHKRRGWVIMPGEEGVVNYVSPNGWEVCAVFAGRTWRIYDGDLQRINV